MGGIGNVSATLGDRYSRGARGPYEPSICSPCRGRRHTVRLLIVPFEDLTYNPPQTIYFPHTPTRHPQRCQETSMVRRPRQPVSPPTQAWEERSTRREGPRLARLAPRQRRRDPAGSLVPPCLWGQ